MNLNILKTDISIKLTGGVMPPLHAMIKPFLKDRKLCVPVKNGDGDLLRMFPDFVLEARGKLGIDAEEDDVNVLAVELIEDNVKKLVWHGACTGLTTARIHGKSRCCMGFVIPFNRDEAFFEPLYSYNPWHLLTRRNLATTSNIEEAIDKTIQQMENIGELCDRSYIKLADVKPENISEYLSEIGTDGVNLSYSYERSVEDKAGNKSTVFTKSEPQHVDKSLLRQACSRPLHIKELLAVLSNNGNVWGDLTNNRTLGKTEKALELYYDSNDYYSIKNGFIVGCYYDLELRALRDNILPLSADNIAGQAGKMPSPIYHINMPSANGYNFFLTKLGSKGYTLSLDKEIRAFVTRSGTANTIVKAGNHCYCEKVVTEIAIDMALLKTQGLTKARLLKQGIEMGAPMRGDVMKKLPYAPLHIYDRISDSAKFVVLTDIKGLNTIKEVDKIIKCSNIR